MKIVYLFNGRLPTEKAHGLQIAKSCEAFAQAGFDVELLVSYRANKIKEDIFSYYGLKKKFRIKNVFGVDFRATGKIAYMAQTGISALSLLLYLFFKFKKQDTIFYARDYSSLFALSLFGFRPVAEFHDYRFNKKRKFLQFILNHSRKIIVNSKGTRELLFQHYAIDQGKIMVAPNGVDLDFFSPEISKEEARKELGLPEGIIIGYTGRLEMVGVDKGVGWLLAVFSGIKSGNTTLCIVGGPDEMVDYYKKIEKIAGTMATVNRVIFTGQVRHEKIPLYLKAMDIVVIPLLSGRHARTTSPMKLFEYMAAGKAILASDVPSLRDYLNDNNSLLFGTDSDSLTHAIDRLIADRDLAVKIGSQARKDAQKYSWLNRARTIKDFVYE